MINEWIRPDHENEFECEENNYRMTGKERIIDPECCKKYRLSLND
jgi:hypothetical protein